MAKNSKKNDEYEKQIQELTEDLQRTRADFENYRKRIEQEKQFARESGKTDMILKLLPIIDVFERALSFMPDEIKDNKWVQGVCGINKKLETSFESLGLKRIEAAPGTIFNPELHEAIQFDEEAKGDQEVIEELLQQGYLFNGKPIRHSMVKVTRK